MIKIAITGNIASGKSQVEQMLLSKGFKVIDTDEINNELLFNDFEVKNEIKSVFGKEVFIDGKIFKQKLANIVFNSKDKKQMLEHIMHKRIWNKINVFFNENIKEKIVFVSVPILFEVQWENRFDRIIFVSADEKTRLKRLINRNNYTVQQAKLRINAQQSEEEKIKKSNFVIYNNSTIENLRKDVICILEKLI